MTVAAAVFGNVKLAVAPVIVRSSVSKIIGASTERFAKERGGCNVPHGILPLQP